MNGDIVKRIAATAVLLGLNFATGTALAHGDSRPDSPAHGGQVRTAGALHYELVVAKDARDGRESPIVVYVTDDAGKKVASAGAKGNAVLLAGKLKASATLVPDGDNRLKGAAVYAATPDLKVVVSITLPGTPARQARFAPLAANAGQPDHKH